MHFTMHAKMRWEERFPDFDKEIEWRQSSRVGKKRKAQLKEQCPEHIDYMGTTFKGCYYRVSNKGVVFVVSPKETVLTVFPYGGKDEKEKVR